MLPIAKSHRMFACDPDYDFDDESFVSSEDEQEKYKFDKVGAVLMEACEEGKLDLVKKLVTKENVNSIINRRTPLIAACRGDRLNVVKYLVEIGADVLKHGKDCRDDFYPLTTACGYGSLTLVKFLLDNGADKGVNKSGYGNRALHEVGWNRKDRNGEIAKLLIAHGAKVDARGSFGKTPLIAACAAQSTSIFGRKISQPKQIRVLLEAGADPNAYNMDGESPLTLSYGSPPIFRLLVEYGADLEEFEPPPYEWYMFYQRYTKNYVKCFELLLEYNAGVDIPCRHERCQKDVLMCCYFQCRDRGAKFYVKRFEEHFIKMETAGLYFGRGNSFILQQGMLMYHRGMAPVRFREACQAELTRMSSEKIGDTGATCLDVLHQRRWALLRVEEFPLEAYQHKFPIYGGLIRSRFVVGRMKLQLIDKCSRFFELTELPRLPPLCVSGILGYLSVRDLKAVLAAHRKPSKEELIEAEVNRLLNLEQSADHGSTSEEPGLVPPVDDHIALKRKSSDGGNTGSKAKVSKLSVGASSQSDPGPSSAVDITEPGPSSN